VRLCLGAVGSRAVLEGALRTIADLAAARGCGSAMGLV